MARCGKKDAFARGSCCSAIMFLFFVQSARILGLRGLAAYALLGRFLPRLNGRLRAASFFLPPLGGVFLSPLRRHFYFPGHRFFRRSHTAAVFLHIRYADVKGACVCCVAMQYCCGAIRRICPPLGRFLPRLGAAFGRPPFFAPIPPPRRSCGFRAPSGKARPPFWRARRKAGRRRRPAPACARPYRGFG